MWRFFTLCTYSKANVKNNEMIFIVFGTSRARLYEKRADMNVDLILYGFWHVYLVQNVTAILASRSTCHLKFPLRQIHTAYLFSLELSDINL